MSNDNGSMLNNPLSAEDFEMFVSTLVRGLVQTIGLRDAEHILHAAFLRIQSKLAYRSVSDAVQKLVERIIVREYRLALKEK